MKRNENDLLFLAVFLTPAVAVSSPICLFTALYFFNPFTPEVRWLSGEMLRFVLTNVSLFLVLNGLKYPFFVKKRQWAEKKTGLSLFFTTTILSQIPYIFIPVLLRDYLQADITSGAFAVAVMVAFCVLLWVSVTVFYNYLILKANDYE